MTENLIDRQQVAKMLGLSDRSSLPHFITSRPTFPDPVKKGTAGGNKRKITIYDKKSVQNWIANNPDKMPEDRSDRVYRKPVEIDHVLLNFIAGKYRPSNV